MLIGAVLVWAAIPRIQDRVDAWLYPFDDAQGLGYQSVQSIYALAEGGVFGPGLGRAFLLTADGSTVIPALETDFIFSAVASELGFIGGVGVLLMYLLMVQRGFSIASEATDGFSKLLAGGLTALVGIQAILIVGGVIRLVPLTGVTLPFLSYGGSSVVTNFGLVALLLVVSHRSRAESRRARRR
jgi:cell division protein FtsW (lipid II flippase)